MQQLIVLFDEPFQRLLGPGLGLQEVALLIPGLLHLPFLAGYLSFLDTHPLNGLVIPVPHIHDGLGPDDGSICNLYLVP